MAKKRSELAARCGRLESVFDVVPPAEALATFVTLPAFRSACVIVWLAVQVMDSPGSR